MKKLLQIHDLKQKLFWCFAMVLVLLNTEMVFAQTPYNMSSGNKTWDFTGSWTVSGNTYTGTDAGNWSSVAIIGTGNSVTTGIRTTKSSAAIASGASGGFQKPSGTIQLLSTGSSATPEAVAIDLLLNFTGRVAGTLSFDWAAIDNGSGTRPTSLRVFWSIDGTSYTELTAAQSLDRESATSPSSGSITNIALPSAFNGSATARLRFYNYAGSNAIGANNRDKMQIDNVSVTSTAAATISSTGTPISISSTYGSASSQTSFDVSGLGLSAGISINPPVGFDVSTTSDFTSTVGSNGSPITVGSSGTVAATTIYVRLSNGLSAGNYNGTIVLSSSGAASVNVALNGTNTVNKKVLTISNVSANNKTFDNTTTATLSGTPLLVGVVLGDELNVTLGGTPVANFNNALVGTGKPVTVTGYSISGSKSGNYSLTQPTGLVADIISSGLSDQTITFGSLANVTYGDASFNLTASSDSGLDLTYVSSNTNVATILGNVVTIVGAGTTTITASQSGNASYNPAVSVDQNLLVIKKSLKSKSNAPRIIANCIVIKCVVILCQQVS
ncbi:MAG: hypothetical protein K2P85_01195 [Flavobacteriaceae bacterium]|nr:hypothetical protein [Flavobacteriaceae bacterium]